MKDLEKVQKTWRPKARQAGRKFQSYIGGALSSLNILNRRASSSLHPLVGVQGAMAHAHRPRTGLE